MNAHWNAICIAEAEMLASSRNDDGALGLLELVPPAQAAPLRARIYCRQGKFSDAARCWQEALQADPGDNRARKGLALAQSLDRSPVGWLRLHARRWVFAVLLVAVVVGSVWAVVRTRASAQAQNVAASLDELRREVRALDDRTRENTNTLQATVHPQSPDSSNEVIRGQLRGVQRALRRIESKLSH